MTTPAGATPAGTPIVQQRDELPTPGMEEHPSVVSGIVSPHASIFPTIHKPHFEPPPSFLERPASELCAEAGKAALNLIGPFNWAPKYTKQKLLDDFVGGLLIAIMIVPQSLAYAQLAGLPPVYGLYAAITPQILYGIFGTTPILGVGPVALVSILTAQLTDLEVTEDDKAGVATLLAFEVGFMSLCLSIIQAGVFTRFISHTTTSAFTSGAAVLIMLSQFKHFFGIKVKTAHTLHEYIDHIVTGFKSAEIYTVYIFLFVLVFTLYLMLIKFVKVIPKSFPHQICVVLVAVIITYAASLNERMRLPIVGDVPSGAPSPRSPDFSKFFKEIQISSITVVVSFVESFAVARKFSMELEYEVSGNRELFALGMVNAIAAFFRCYATTGSISRTAVAAALKTKTPFFAVISGILVLVVLVGLNRLSVFYYLPVGILSAIIISSCVKMIDYEKAISLWKSDKKDFVLWVVTLLAVLFLGVEIGIMIGVGLGLVIGVLRLTAPSAPELGLKYTEWHHRATFRNVEKHEDVETFAKVALFRFDAPLLFFNIESLTTRFEVILTSAHYSQLRVVLLDCAGITEVDSDGVHTFVDIFTLAKKRNVLLICSEMRIQIKNALEAAEKWPEPFNDDNCFASTLDALEVAQFLAEDAIKADAIKAEEEHEKKKEEGQEKDKDATTASQKEEKSEGHTTVVSTTDEPSKEQTEVFPSQEETVNQQEKPTATATCLRRRKSNAKKIAEEVIRDSQLQDHVQAYGHDGTSASVLVKKGGQDMGSPQTSVRTTITAIKAPEKDKKAPFP